MIELEVDGQPFSNFTSLSYSKSMTELAGQFSFVATQADSGEFPIRRGSSVRVLVNSIPVITGFIDAFTPTISASENSINIQGRDKTADIVDSTLNADSVELAGAKSLQDVIERTIAAIGANIKVVNQVTNLEDFTDEDLQSSEAGQNAFQFIEAFARKRQVLLHANGDGDIVIARSSEQILNYRLINRKDGVGNNIKRASISYDDSKRYNQYIVVSQQNMTTLNNFGLADLDQVVDSKNDPIIDSEIRAGRVLHMVAEKSSNPDQARLRAIWERNFRIAQSLTYTATTDDKVDPNTDEPFPINRLINIQDEDNGGQAIRLIESISVNFDVSRGTETTFNTVPRNAYTVKLEEPINEERADTFGDFFS